MGGEVWAGDGENLRALIDAFETFLGFRNSFNWGDPEFAGFRGVQGDANVLPAVLDANGGRGQDSAETKIGASRGSFKEAVGFSGGKEIDDGF